MEFTVKLTVSIKVEAGWPDVNEIVGDVDQIGNEMKQALMELLTPALQQDYLSQDGVERNLAHSIPKSDQPCEHRDFRRAGTRERSLKTPFGTVNIVLQQLRCKACGKFVTPFFDVLGLKQWDRLSQLTQRQVLGIVTETSYRRTEGIFQSLGQTFSRMAIHSLVTKRDWDFTEDPSPAVTHLMVDGTGYHGIDGNRKDLRVVIGVNSTGTTCFTQCYVGKDWSVIAEDLKQRKLVPRQVTVDGEPGIDAVAEALKAPEQRCQVHFTRDLGYTLWKDGVTKAGRDRLTEQAQGLLAVEVPLYDTEPVRPADRQYVEARIDKRIEELRLLAEEIRGKGYLRAATYIEGAVDKLFTRLRLWIETGLICPATTNRIEQVMGQIARRIKHIHAKWGDVGLEKMVKVLLKKVVEPLAWAKFWVRELGGTNCLQLKLLECKVDYA